MIKKLLTATSLSLSLMTFLLPGAAYGAPGQASPSITEESAKQIALNHAGISQQDLSLIYAKLDREHGKLVYDVEFYTPDYVEYDYEIDASNGTILSMDYEAEFVQPAPAGQGGASITLDQAKAIALKQAGLTDSQVVFVKAKQDLEHGKLLYECEFVYQTTEYEYEIDAYTGTILEMDMDSIYD